MAALLDRTLPDLTLPSTHGPYALRGHIGVCPQVLFFYVKNGTAT